MGHDALQRLFTRITAYPKVAVLVGCSFIAAAGSGLVNLVKDISIDAFVPDDHPSLIANEQTTELFGISEPIAVAVFTDGESVFTASTLGLIDEITEGLRNLDNIREDRVASITSESSIRGDDGAISIDPYFDAWEPNGNPGSAAERWASMPPHVDTLVSDDQTAAVVMAEVIDSHRTAETYAAVKNLVADLSAPGTEIVVAGPAAVSGYLSDYIDADARVMQPVAFVIVMTFLFLAFLRLAALLGPILVLLGAAGGALGTMAWQGIPYFAITNALPVILVAISVADAIHILSAYYERRARFKDAAERDLVIDAMVAMARPITLTTLTTIAGFFGIAAVSIMPPISYFAGYAMLGVFLAWAFSLFVLPNALVLLKPKPSPLFAAWGVRAPDVIGAMLGQMSLFAARRPLMVLGCFFVCVLVALAGASQLRIDRSQVENFSPDEPIRIADERINETFAGTAFLDVLVTSDDPDGVLTTHAMEKIADLQEFLEGLEHVTKTVSIVDYLSLLHSALNDEPATQTRSLPSETDAIAQYLMVYEASGDPTDLEEEITPDYQAALIRGVIDSPYFSDSRPVVAALADYLETEFNEPGLTGTISGDVNVAYHWMSRLYDTHFLGVGLSLLLILAMAMTVFRSAVIGLISVIPVTFTVLCIYGVMGYAGVYLEPATSMFAAISVGVGVDFAIHLVDRLQFELRRTEHDLLTVIATVVPSTARACFFNAGALAMGFSVLLISDLPTLQRFGGLVTVAAVVSFLVALIIVPACYALLGRLGGKHASSWGHLAGKATGKAVGASVLVGIVTLAPAPQAFAEQTSAVLQTSPAAQTWDGRAVAERVASRPEANALTRTIAMTLTDKRGRVRNRRAIVFRRTADEERVTRITYLAPKAVRELTFLSRELDAGSRDERWLYIPATRKVRRIPASDRGDYFLGTDFTYEDIQSNFKFEVADFTFDYTGEQERSGQRIHAISGTPVTSQLSRELGYGHFRAIVEERTWFPVTIEFFTPRDEPLKTIDIDSLEVVDGIWTPRVIRVQHHRTGHSTIFEYENIEHTETLPDALFRAQELNRGLPRPWDGEL
jgi:predicted RND superfamily exporter protein